MSGSVSHSLFVFSNTTGKWAGPSGGCLFVAFYQIRLAFSEGLGCPRPDPVLILSGYGVGVAASTYTNQALDGVRSRDGEEKSDDCPIAPAEEGSRAESRRLNSAD